MSILVIIALTVVARITHMVAAENMSGESMHNRHINKNDRKAVGQMATILEYLLSFAAMVLALTVMEDLLK